MKAQKRLNVVLIVLIIILISLISFVGIYYKDKNEMKNILPSYILGTDLTGYRKVSLEVNKDSETKTETATTDNTTSENEVSQNATSENEVTDANSENKSQNYIQSATIIKKRLKSLKVDDYTVSCDESTGKIQITLPENDQTDTILADITQQGNFSVEDSSTGEKLLSNEDISSVKVGENKSYSTTSIYMNINFNTKGAKKFKDITKTYQNVVQENTTSNTSSNTTDNTTIQNTSNDTNTATNETNTATGTADKKVVLKIDDTTMMTTNFSQIIDNGVLALTVGSSTDVAELKDKLYGGYNLAAILENDAMPEKYKISENTYVASAVENNTLKIIVYIEIGIALLIALFIVIKFRKNGVLMTILSIGYLAILLIVIRYANVTLSLEGILAIEISYIINCIFSYMLCTEISKNSDTKKEKKKALNTVIKKYILTLIPEIIISVVCCLTEWTSIFSLGMTMFWGITISLIYNVITSKLLINQISK